MSDLEQARRIAIALEQQNAEVLRLLLQAQQHGYTGTQAALAVQKAIRVLRTGSGWYEEEEVQDEVPYYIRRAQNGQYT